MGLNGDEPIAIVGGGLAGITTLTNVLMQIAHSSPEGSPAVAVALIETVGPRHKGDTPYPLNGLSARDLHPFDSKELPNESFLTFGEYVDDLSEDEPGLRGALLEPSYRQITEYVQFMLEMAIVFVGGRAVLAVNKTAIKDIQPTTQDGPATIMFTDGTSLQARRVIRAKDPPHMAGQPSESPMILVTTEAYLALASSGLKFEHVAEGDPPGTFTFTITIGSRRIAVETLDLPDAELCRRVSDKLLPRLRRGGGTELWIVTQYSIDASVGAQFNSEPVQFLPLWQFTALMEKMKLFGGGEMRLF